MAAVVKQALAGLDDALFDLWNLGENVLLAWTHEGQELRFLCVRHYTIAAAVRPDPAPSRHYGACYFILLLAF